MNINQLRKIVLETINEGKQSKTKSHNQKLREGLRRAKLILEGDESESNSGSKGGFNKTVQAATKLKDVDVDTAKGLLQIKDSDPSDAIQIGKLSASCADLKPSQSSMNLGKAVHFALGMLKGTMYGSGGPGGNLGAFTCGGYLLDGHHRWIATCMVKPEAKVEGYDMQGIDPKDAVRILNVATAAVMGHNKGKEGEGSFGVFSEVEKVFEALKSKDADAEGVPNTPGTGEATKVCETWAASEGNGETGEDALKWAAQKMVDNCGKCPGVSDSAVLISSNKRVDMPVADDPEHAKKQKGDIEAGFGGDSATQNLINTFQSGGIDIRESSEVKRWNKLAGTLLKD